MTWVIAILLALILVAMISSNQAAATGVGKVVHFALLGLVTFIAWMVVIGYCVWYYEAYPSGEWTQIIGIAVGVLFPPLVVSHNWKVIWKVYTEDKRKALKYTAGVVGYIGAMMVAMPVYQELRAFNEHLGWTILLTMLGFTSSVLLWRSFTSTSSLKEVWNGPDNLPDPWAVISDERYEAQQAEEADWDKVIAIWDELTDEQRDRLRTEHHARAAAIDERLKIKQIRLEAEKALRDKEAGNLSVVKVFWWVFIFSIFGLIGIAWDYGYDYAIEIKAVKGRAWLAVLIVLGGMVLLGSCLISFADFLMSSFKKPVVKSN